MQLPHPEQRVIDAIDELVNWQMTDSDAAHVENVDWPDMEYLRRYANKLARRNVIHWTLLAAFQALLLVTCVMPMLWLQAPSWMTGPGIVFMIFEIRQAVNAFHVYRQTHD